MQQGLLHVDELVLIAFFRVVQVNAAKDFRMRDVVHIRILVEAQRPHHLRKKCEVLRRLNRLVEAAGLRQGNSCQYLARCIQFERLVGQRS
jgi:hypothetical protein